MTNTKQILVERQGPAGKPDVEEFPLEVSGPSGKSGKLFGGDGAVVSVDVLCCSADPLTLTPADPAKVCACGLEYQLELKKGKPVVYYNDVIVEYHARHRSHAYLSAVKRS